MLPALHRLYANPCVQEYWRLRGRSPTSQKLIDEKRSPVESVDHPDIELGIGEPAQPAADPVAGVQVDGRPGPDGPCRHRARIAVAAGMVHSGLYPPTVQCPGEMRGQSQSQSRRPAPSP